MRPFGKYQLIRRLAAGGMAEVYLATGPNPRNAELLALKLILQAFAEDEGFMKMFLTEARLTAPLHHPNLVEIFDLGMADDQLYLAMEYIPGKPLSQIRKRAYELARQQASPGSPLVTPLLAAAMIRQAASGLHEVHEARSPAGEPLGLVHRDVSPQNLMLDQSGSIKVVDFGVAKATAAADVSRTGSLKGKVGYIAPEQLREGIVDRQVDVFALGAVLFELATHEPLFNGRSEAELLRQSLLEPTPDMSRFPDLDPRLAKIIARAIERDRSKRYPTAKAMEEDLSAFLGSPPRAGQRQLATLMSQLFEPFPTTAAEALSDPGVVQPGVAEVLAQARPSTEPPVDDEKTISSRKWKDALPETRPYPDGGPSALITDPSPPVSPALAEDERTATASVSVTRRDPRKRLVMRTRIGLVLAGAVAATAAAWIGTRRNSPLPAAQAPAVSKGEVSPRPGAAQAPTHPSPSQFSNVLELDDGKSANGTTLEIRLSDLRSQAQKSMAVGDYEGAISALHEALKENPNDAASRRLMGSCQASRGDFAEAAAQYQKFVELAPHDPQALEIMRLLDTYKKKLRKDEK